MSERASLRVVATHDFCCAYPPSPTSYGSLPGGEGLKRALDTLRAQGPTVRADAGDFAAPGALATLSNGKASFAAAADLGLDVGVVGNHEFEWGIEHLRAHAPETSFPLLCANAPEVGLPPATVVRAHEFGANCLHADRVCYPSHPCGDRRDVPPHLTAQIRGGVSG
jgi:2',3'-cyclic-nucleotide 2'-phosphodiesterase (5'-nucleotidase family)